MLQLRLTFDDPTGGRPPPPPAACPRPGCGGRVRHWQSVVKRVRGAAGGVATAERYVCLDCRRTFRVYPEGIDRGTVPTAAKRWAAALHDLGLPYRDVSRALAVLGVTLGKSRVQTLARPLVGAGQPRPGWLGALLERVEIEGEGSDAGAAADAGAGAGAAGGEGTGAVVRDATGDGAPATAHGHGDGGQAERRAWVWIQGRRHALRRVVDASGRAVLVVDGVARDLFYVVDAWAGAMLAEHGVHAAVGYFGDAGRRRDGAPSRILVGGIGWDVAVRAGDSAQASGLDPIGMERAVVAAAGDQDGGGPTASILWFGAPSPPGHPRSLWSTAAAAPRGWAHRGGGRAPGDGIGARLGAPVPRIGRARHRPGRRKGPLPDASGGLGHALRGARRPRAAA